MARITVEDCLENVDNRFQLVLIASKRARQLAFGSESKLDWDNDKPAVVALREVADSLVGRSVLDEADRAVETMEAEQMAVAPPDELAPGESIEEPAEEEPPRAAPADDPDGEEAP